MLRVNAVCMELTPRLGSKWGTNAMCGLDGRQAAQCPGTNVGRPVRRPAVRSSQAEGRPTIGTGQSSPGHYCVPPEDRLSVEGPAVTTRFQLHMPSIASAWGPTSRLYGATRGTSSTLRSACWHGLRLSVSRLGDDEDRKREELVAPNPTRREQRVLRRHRLTDGTGRRPFAETSGATTQCGWCVRHTTTDSISEASGELCARRIGASPDVGTARTAKAKCRFLGSCCRYVAEESRRFFELLIAR